MKPLSGSESNLLPITPLASLKATGEYYSPSSEILNSDPSLLRYYLCDDLINICHFH